MAIVWGLQFDERNGDGCGVAGEIELIRSRTYALQFVVAQFIAFSPACGGVRGGTGEKSCIKKRDRINITLRKLDLWLTNWQIVISAIIGALVATVGYIAVELMKSILKN